MVAMVPDAAHQVDYRDSAKERVGPLARVLPLANADEVSGKS
jgi:hypothetical protein